ncbi:MAG: SH3 domain-containing protein, partial [Anaerolineaceae bacterium]
MKTNKTRPIAILSVAVVLLSACNLPGTTVIVPTSIPPDVIYTAAAQTLAAQLTQNAPPPGQPTDTPIVAPPVVEATNTPLISPTFTEGPFTATPEFTNTPIFTPTSTNPTITASMPTNCRTGTSTDYPRVGSLVPGQVAEVVGRNSTSTWWYIKNPNNPSSFCWIWGETTSVSGNTAALQVMTPPPPPATSTSETGSKFSASYSNTHKCSGDKYAFFKITNNGSKDLESASIKINDETDDDNLSTWSSNKPFLASSDDCDTEDTVVVGETGYLA